MKSKREIAIIGVGNYLMGDEGVGIHAIKYLEQFSWPENIELIDAGVPGPALIHMLEGRKLSIIIDCADFQGNPGDILVVPEKGLKKPDEQMISLHGSSLIETLALAEQTDIDIGDVIIICVQPKEINFSRDISDEISHALPRIKGEIEKLI